MAKKLKIVVLMGGKSSEHEVSGASGRGGMKKLDKSKDNAVSGIMAKDGQGWKIPKGVDLTFLALHGPFGEDGAVQGMLETAGIKYTGSGVLASAIGMDKIIFKRLMLLENIPIPKFVVVKHGENLRHIRKVIRKRPYFVKPNNQGSSVGCTLVKKQKDLGKALKLAHGYSRWALVEEHIRGMEITCGILGNDRPVALPIVEIISKNEFFDYESKYTESKAQEIIPARIPRKLALKVQNIALKVYKAVGAKGFGRVDFILKKGKEPVVLEINTIPGLTPASLLPKEAKAAGITYPQLLDTIIEYANEKN